MGKEQIVHECMGCARKITEKEFEKNGGFCETCFEVELVEIDHDAMLEETEGEEEAY